jgi:predicted SAM-dependent methyltransferase
MGMKNDVSDILDRAAHKFRRGCLYPVFRKKELASQLRGCERLNLGSGEQFLPGWLSVSLFSGKPYSRVVPAGAGQALNFDLRDELPLAPGSLSYIYGSHFIEHIGFCDGLALFSRCARYLRPGGVLRLTYPDLGLWCEKYAAGDRDFFEKYRRLNLAGQDYAAARTNGEILMAQLRGWGHMWAYDLETMRLRLAEAGFSKVEKRAHRRGALSDIEALEPALEGRLMETAFVEAVR